MRNGYTYPKFGYNHPRGRFRDTFKEKSRGVDREANKRRRQAIKKARELARTKQG